MLFRNWNKGCEGAKRTDIPSTRRRAPWALKDLWTEGIKNPLWLKEVTVLAAVMDKFPGMRGVSYPMWCFQPVWHFFSSKRRARVLFCQLRPCLTPSMVFFSPTNSNTSLSPCFHIEKNGETKYGNGWLRHTGKNYSVWFFPIFCTWWNVIYSLIFPLVHLLSFQCGVLFIIKY